MRSHLFKTLAAASMALAAQAGHQAVAQVVDINNGVVTGAQDILIGGTLYDVTFETGVAIGPSPYTFSTAQDAAAAGNALINQVFAGLDFSSVGDCAYQTTIACEILTPYQDSASNVLSALSIIGFDRTNSALQRARGPYEQVLGNTFAVAVFTPSSVPVPEPASIAVAAAGVAGLAGAKLSRRKKAKKTG
jgi:hypothetical protein